MEWNDHIWVYSGEGGNLKQEKVYKKTNKRSVVIKDVFMASHGVLYIS